jgi:hypothetical protein
MTSLARGLETDLYHATRAVSAETAAALQARAQRRALSCYSVQVSSDDGNDATCFMHVDYCKRRVRFIKKQVVLDEWPTDAIIRVSGNACASEARKIALKHHHSLLRSKLTCADLLSGIKQGPMEPIPEEGSSQVSSTSLVIHPQGLMLFTMQRLPIRILCANSLHRNHMVKLLRCVCIMNQRDLACLLLIEFYLNSIQLHKISLKLFKSVRFTRMRSEIASDPLNQNLGEQTVVLHQGHAERKTKSDLFWKKVYLVLLPGADQCILHSFINNFHI